MAGGHKFAFRIAIVAIAFWLLGTGGWFYLNWSLSRSLRSLDLAPFATIMEKAGSDLVVMKRRGPAQSPLPRGYLVAYQQDPEGFRGDARLFETWVHAMSLATSVLENGPSGDWVRSSSALESARAGSRLDPWQHPFCLLRRGDAVLAISGGARAPESPTCNNIVITAEDLATFPQGKLLESASGSLVLVVAKDSLWPRQTSTR